MEVKTNLKYGFGAVIDRVNISKLDQNNGNVIRNLLYKNKILIFKNQTITATEYIEFAKKIGQPVCFIDPDYQHPDHPEIFVSSNMKINNKKIGMDRVGYYWHTDCSFLDNPLPITMLHAQVVSEAGGETSFINMKEIYDDLPQTLKNQLQNKHATHEGKWRYIIRTEDAGFSIQEVLQRDEELIPSAIHPVLIKHPYTREEILYINEGFTRKIIELSFEESEEILNKLFSILSNHKNIYHHQWEVGDLIIWDNRLVVHKASPPGQGQDRMMYRIGISDGKFYQ